MLQGIRRGRARRPASSARQRRRRRTRREHRARTLPRRAGLVRDVHRERLEHTEGYLKEALRQPKGRSVKRITILLVPALIVCVIVGAADGATKPHTVNQLCGWVEKGGNKDTFNDFSFVRKHQNDLRFCLTGVPGAAGAIGAQGEAGIGGAAGATGATGSTGATGAKGATGEVGARGETGEAGVKGDVGLTGATGAAGSQGETGATGD